jgi:hypothetical protein
VVGTSWHFEAGAKRGLAELDDGAIVAEQQRMKLLPLVVVGFSAVASAAPATHHVAVAITAQAHTRQYAVELLDETCGKAASKSSTPKLEDSFDDQVSLCSSNGALKIDWMTREGTREIHMSSTLTAQPNVPITIEGGGAKLTLKIS